MQQKNIDREIGQLLLDMFDVYRSVIVIPDKRFLPVPLSPQKKITSDES
jgi:hypothetical protein